MCRRIRDNEKHQLRARVCFTLSLYASLANLNMYIYLNDKNNEFHTLTPIKKSKLDIL